MNDTETIRKVIGMCTGLFKILDSSGPITDWPKEALAALDRMVEREKKMREALEWYGNKDNYQEKDHTERLSHGYNHARYSAVEMDKGKRARDALKGENHE